MAANAIYSVLGRVAGLGAGPGLNQVNLVIGVDKEIQILSDELKRVINVLDDAEKKRCKDKLVGDWLTRLENTTYEMDDVLDEWNAAIREFETEEHSFDNVVLFWLYKVRSFIPSSCLLCFEKVVVRRDIALKVKDVIARLDLILAEKDRYGFATTPQPSDRESWRGQTTSFIDLEEIYGRDLEREDVVRQLVGKGGSSEEGLIGGIRVISIVGVGGLGKTTLAQLAYNDRRVKNCFELRIWISVSDPFDVFGIANGIIEKASGSKQDTKQLDMLLDCLTKSILGKKFLLVLDDVWTEDDTKWKPLKNALKSGGTGSKVLVTTRNERVAIMMMGGFIKNDQRIHRLGVLNDEDCWSLFRRIALCGKNKNECEELENTSKEIANKCKGLPLAIKTLASVLRFKNTLEEWESVLNSEIWKLEEVEDDLFRHLLLSYNELSPTLKRCFSYCAVFPKDTRIDVDELITKWMAMGYLRSNADDDWKVRGRGYFDNLTMRSLFQDFYMKDDDIRIESFMMHDIVHDFAEFLRKNVGSRMKNTTCKDCSHLLVSRVEKYRSLCQCKEVLDPHVCDCLASVRLLDLRGCGLQAIPKEIGKLIHLRWLDLGYNQFVGDDLKSICKLYNLQFLWVKGCGLQEIPLEIGNLSELIHLNLSWNRGLRELPESLCNLSKLEILNVNWCSSLCGLPQGIHRLKKLKHLYNKYTYSLEQYPQGISQLTSLVTLNKVFPCDGNKVGWLKNFNRLSGKLELLIEISSCDSVAVVVEDAREAELAKKTQIRELIINFDVDEPSSSTSDWNEVLDALHPHPNLQQLTIKRYNGSQLPEWIVSPLNQLTSIGLDYCEFLVSLPPLGKLPLLETLRIEGLPKLEYVGREFLGIATCSSMGTIAGGFPKLKKLTFWKCINWTKWEDITVEEEEEDNVAISIMPCLTELEINACWRLMDLPQRLMRKVSSSLKVLHICGSKVVDALEPHPNLHNLMIYQYEGSQLPRWITSPLNQLTYVQLRYCEGLPSLPPLGKLPLLETLEIISLSKLEYVGREFLGIATCSSMSTIAGGFPKLKKLTFRACNNWKKWEDITVEEDNVAISIMPCLTELTIYDCSRLTELPQRLLQKVSPSLKWLDITGSTQLIQVYGDKEGQPWKSISRHNPHLRLFP